MSIVNLDIPVIIQGTKQSVEYYPKILDLNEGYQQITGGKEHKITWTFVTRLTPYETIKTWTDFLDSFDAATEFRIFLSDELGSKIVYCDSYNLQYITHDRGQLTMECTESDNSEYVQLKDLLSLSVIPSALQKAVSFIQTWSTNSSETRYRYLSYSPTLPCLYVHPYENFHTGDPTSATNNLFQIDGGKHEISDVCGTVESAALNILALMEISQIIESYPAPAFLASQIASSLISVAYRTVQPPIPFDSKSWLPNWLYAVKDASWHKSLPTSAPKFNETDDTNYALWDSVTFTQIGTSTTWKAQLPSSLDQVFRVIAFSNLGGQTETKNPTTKVINGVELEIVNWKDQSNKLCVYYGYYKLLEKSNFVNADSPGCLYIIAPGWFTGQARVVYSVYKPPIPKFTLMHNSPFWRELPSSETVVDLGSIKYLYEAFDSLSGVDTLYSRARDATKFSFEKVSQLANLNNPFENVASLNSAMDIPGINLIHVGNRVGRVAKNISDITVYQSADSSNSSSLVIQHTNTKIYWNEFTVFLCVLSSNLNHIYESQFIELKFDVVNNDSTAVYKVALPIPYDGFTTNYSITAKDLVNWGVGCNWYPTYRNDPFISVSSFIGLIDVYYEQTPFTNSRGNTNNAFVARIVMHRTESNPGNLNAQIVLNPRQPWGNNPPRFAYKLKNGRVLLKIFDQNNNAFTKIITPNNSWAIAIYEWGDLTPAGSVTVPVLPIKAIYFLDYVDIDAELSLYWFGEEPTLIPLPSETKRVYFENKIRFAHDWTLKWSLSNSDSLSTNDFLPYVPGIIPSRAIFNGTNRVRYGGSVHIGYQTYRLWQKWNRPIHCALVLEFLKQSAEQYKTRSPIRQIGLFRPLFSLELWDLPSRDQSNTFYEITQPTNNFPDVTVSTEPLSMIHNLKMIVDLSEAWRHDPNNTDLENLVMNFLNAINDFWVQNGDPGKMPNFVINAESLIPIHRVYGEPFPQGTALLMVAAINANIVGKDRLLTFKIINHCFTFLKNEQFQTGVMAGAWAITAPDVLIDSTVLKKYRTDLHAHIIRAYCKLWNDRNNLRFPTYQDWLVDSN